MHLLTGNMNMTRVIIKWHMENFASIVNPKTLYDRETHNHKIMLIIILKTI